MRAGVCSLVCMLPLQKECIWRTLLQILAAILSSFFIVLFQQQHYRRTMEINRLQELDEHWYLGGDDWYAAAASAVVLVVVALVVAGDQCVAVVAAAAVAAARIRSIGILLLLITHISFPLNCYKPSQEKRQCRLQ